VIGNFDRVAVPVAAQFFFCPATLRVPISPMSVVIAFVVSWLNRLVLGYLPAKQRGTLQPIESLRYE